jgi:hypothetical protein
MRWKAKDSMLELIRRVGPEAPTADLFEDKGGGYLCQRFAIAISCHLA